MNANRKNFVGGNFKMNGDKKILDGIIENLNKVSSPNTGQFIIYQFLFLMLYNKIFKGLSS